MNSTVDPEIKRNRMQA